MGRYADKYTALATLFLAGLGGDSRAYAQFLAEIAPLLSRMVARKCMACDVEDVVQEIIISIHKARHTYDGKRPLMPWLASIAVFRITDYLRKHYAQRKDKSVNIHELEDVLADVTETEGGYESIDKWLEDVPEHQKRILTLMHVEGYTAKEVGMQMNMNESAVKVAAHRALKKIRKKFGT